MQRISQLFFLLFYYKRKQTLHKSLRIYYDYGHKSMHFSTKKSLYFITSSWHVLSKQNRREKARKLNANLVKALKYATFFKNK